MNIVDSMVSTSYKIKGPPSPADDSPSSDTSDDTSSEDPDHKKNGNATEGGLTVRSARIARLFGDTAVSQVREIELWLFRGAMSNITAIFLKLAGYKKPFNINHGTGASVARSFVAEMTKPLFGDYLAHVVLRPWWKGREKARFDDGQCFARLLCFDDDLGL